MNTVMNGKSRVRQEGTTIFIYSHCHRRSKAERRTSILETQINLIAVGKIKEDEVDAKQKEEK
jgi:hypothetical protein